MLDLPPNQFNAEEQWGYGVVWLWGCGFQDVILTTCMIQPVF